MSDFMRWRSRQLRAEHEEVERIRERVQKLEEELPRALSLVLYSYETNGEYQRYERLWLRQPMTPCGPLEAEKFPEITAVLREYGEKAT